MSAYAKQPLASVLTRVQDSVAIDPSETYKQVTVRLFHKGVVLRGEKLGSAIRTTKQWQVHQGQVLLSRIDACNGAIGIVPAGLDGAIVTNDFWVFAVNSKRAIPAFLDAYFGTPGFVDACKAASEGTTNRVRLQPERFLNVEVPLPPLDEQRRILSRIEELAEKVEKARTLRESVVAAADDLIKAEAEACFRNLAATCSTKSLAELQPHVTSGPRNWQNYYSDSGQRFYRAQDIGSNFRIADGNKVFVTPPSNGQAAGAHVLAGDLMLVITGATVGRCAVFPRGGEAGLVNQHVALCRFPEGAVVPEYVLWGLRSESGQAQLIGQRYGQGKPGLNLSNVKAIKLPFPPLVEQRQIVAHLDTVLRKTECLKKLQSETASELDDLMPSILAKAFRGEL